MSPLHPPPTQADLDAPAPLRDDEVEALHALEVQLYSHPWTRGNFADSLRAGRWTRGLRTPEGVLVAYALALPGVEEMHLLNLGVAPDWQGLGLARRLLDELVRSSRAAALPTLWLEVRPSNARALAVYREYGFVIVGRRRGYYPLNPREREDALVMRLHLEVADALR